MKAFYLTQQMVDNIRYDSDLPGHLGYFGVLSFLAAVFIFFVAMFSLAGLPVLASILSEITLYGIGLGIGLGIWSIIVSAFCLVGLGVSLALDFACLPFVIAYNLFSYCQSKFHTRTMASEGSEDDPSLPSQSATRIPEAKDNRYAQVIPDTEECPLGSDVMVLPVEINGHFYDYLSLLRLARESDVVLQDALMLESGGPNGNRYVIRQVVSEVRLVSTEYVLQSPFTRANMKFRTSDYKLCSDDHRRQLGNLKGGISLACLMISDGNIPSVNKNIDYLVFRFVMETLPDDALECYANNIDVINESDVFTVVNGHNQHLAALAYQFGKVETLKALVKKHPYFLVDNYANKFQPIASRHAFVKEIGDDLLYELLTLPEVYLCTDVFNYFAENYIAMFSKTNSHGQCALDFFKQGAESDLMKKTCYEKLDSAKSDSSHPGRRPSLFNWDAPTTLPSSLGRAEPTTNYRIS